MVYRGRGMGRGRGRGLDSTRQGAKSFVSWTMSVGKLVNGKKVPKKCQGAMLPAFKVHN